MFTENLRQLIDKKNGVFSTADALRANVSKPYLGKLVQRGSLERIAPGWYALPDAMIDDLYLYQNRSEHIIYSHETALYLLD